MKARMNTLLLEAARTFEDVSDPFATDWLVKHSVTANECADLSEQIGLAIRTFLTLMKAKPEVIALYVTPAIFASVEDAERKVANG